MHIVIRDLLITWGAAGIWDWIFYSDSSPMKARLASRKINPKYPSADITRFCMFWSTVSTLVASGVEIFWLHLLARGSVVTWSDSLFSFSTLMWLITLPHWRIGHFYFVHRLIHPWRSTVIPDIGQVLYSHVHALHHKSYNPTSWSGISMHPIESFLYYTVCFIPLLGGAHPFILLTAKVDATLGAILGHDGFEYPGSASFPHYLHHAKFEVNYGENLVPLDWLFGTFAASAKHLPKYALQSKKEEDEELKSD